MERSSEKRINKETTKTEELKTTEIKEKFEIFPFKRSYITQSELEEEFSKLQKYELKFINVYYDTKNVKELFGQRVKETDLLYKGKPTLVPLKRCDETFLVDYFNEHVRIHHKRSTLKPSMYETWLNNKEMLLENIPSDHFLSDKKILSNLNKALTKLTKLAPSRPCLPVGFIKWFGAKSVLDLCVGWGERLFAAIATEVRYVGVETNTRLFPCYKEMVDSFGLEPEKYTIIQGQFEQVELPEEKFNLIFVSMTQGCVESDDISNTERTKELSFDFLKRAWNYLEDDGHILLTISNKENITHYLEYMNNLKACEYLGVISYAHVQTLLDGKIGRIERRGNSRYIKTLTTPQQIWIWRKIGKRFTSHSISMKFKRCPGVGA